MSNKIHLRGVRLAITLLLALTACDGSRNPSQESESKSDAPRIRSLSDTASDEYNPTGKFYLAPSSIPNSGMGIFTVKKIPKLSPIMTTADAPSIIVTDAEKHYGDVPNWAHHGYFWNPHKMKDAAISEFEADIISEIVMTFGALSNYHPYIYNVYPDNAIYDDTITSKHSPGLGAYSYHAGHIFFANRDILAGEEIFVHYDSDVLNERGIDRDMLPREEDSIRGSDVVRQMMKFVGKGNIEDPAIEIIADTASILNRRVGSLLPKSASHLQAILSGGSIDSSVARKLADATVVQRSLDWIQSEGTCLDNLVPQVSTLPDAGRGAFAQRFIPKGNIIVPAPLLQIIDKDSMLIPSVEEDQPEPDDAQLLMNYCFSHPHSTLALCPQTNSILLNHCSTRRSYGGHCEKYNKDKNPADRGPNAAIRWASGWDLTTKEWRQLSLDEIDARTLTYE